MNLNYATYINNKTSYSVSGLNFLREFIKEGINVRLFPMDNPTPESNEHGEIIQKTFYQNNIQKWDAPSLRFAHAFDGFNHVSKHRILYTVFELDRINPLEESSILSNDLVITSSSYHAQVLSKYHSNVRVVPLGVDHGIFNASPASTRSLLGIPEDATVFINVGKFERRKCHREICDAFNLAFDPGDNAYLVLLSQNLFIDNNEWNSYYKNSKMGSNILLLEKQSSQRDVADLMKSSDCLVAPSRAEGFNLPVIEAMACGKHVITTNVTAMSDYCSTLNSHLIELSSMEVAYDKPFFNGQGNWFRWEQKHTKKLADLFHYIHYLKQHDDLKQNINGLATAAQYSWQNSAKELIEVIYQ